MQLALSTWHEVEDYLRTSRGIIIPIGSTDMTFVDQPALFVKTVNEFLAQ